jgi:hypothetical protein
MAQRRILHDRPALQPCASGMQTFVCCERLFQLSDERLARLVSPMRSAIDAGSRGFEKPERFGYPLFARTLDEHRRLLVQPIREHMLICETNSLTRRNLVDATCDAAERLDDLKHRYGRMSVRSSRAVARRFAKARVLRARLEVVAGHAGAPASSRELAGDIVRFSTSPVCGKGELFRPRLVVSFRGAETARLAARCLVRRKRPG